MANLNKVMLIGRLTRDPESRTFSNGGKVAKFGFAVNNSKKNPQTGQWEDEPVFLEVEAFNRGETGKLADRVEQYLRKGNQVYLDGHLKLDQWTTQDGQKRTLLKIVLDNMQFLERREDGAGGGGSGYSGGGASSGGASGGSRAPSAPMRRPAPPPEDNYDHGDHDAGPEPSRNSPAEEDIPF